MINKDNGFNLNIRWRFPGGRGYAFAFIALFAFLLVIYANSFHGEWHFDDLDNIVKNSNVHLKSLTWQDIKKTFMLMVLLQISCRCMSKRMDITKFAG